MKVKHVVYSLLFASLVFLVPVGNSPAQNPTPLKVVLVFDIGGRGDGGFNDAAHRGLEKAVAELGVEAVYVDQERRLDRDHAVDAAAASDVDLIIGVGFAFSEKLNQLALKFPRKTFVCVDYSMRRDDKGRPMPLPPNLAGLVFREEEGSYLVGAVAALTSKTGTIGFIGGMDNAIIRRFQAGYLAGARAGRPDILVLSKYAGITGAAFNDPDKGYQIAHRMYQEGADIIYHASGGTGAGLFRAAKETNRLAIGVDVDQSAQAPGLVLTSMLKHIDVAVFESVKARAEGRFSGGLKTFGLKEKGVGFVYDDQNQKLIPSEAYHTALSLQQRIVTGELTVPDSTDERLLLSREELQELLVQLQSEVTDALEKIDGDLMQSAKALAGEDLTGDAARGVLRKVYADNPYIIDCETVSPEGIMVAVEPPGHRASEGSDISAQTHMVRLFKTHEPVLSDSFRSVEGPQAAVIHHPVFAFDLRFMGSVSALFAPEYLLSGIIGPVSSNLPVDIFLMQTDGLIIYDVDAAQIGRNLFTDALYQPFPELVALGEKIASTPDGEGVYSFYLKEGKIPVKKTAFWRTVDLHGTAWRLAIACAQDHMENP
ncbi:BMP family lipoprotein [Desulfatiglans anilini]|uniref:BMP family lipoprotein n=1 Tax=Desulfatiglans anilini TaxID=90728 RepID=UPI001377656C|nr:BMP family ABC transporter substrate-binding protein [Desulfatiglans anilini]